MEVYRFPHLKATVYISIFKKVENASSLKARLVAASTMQGEEGECERTAVNFAFIDAKLVIKKSFMISLGPNVKLLNRLRVEWRWRRPSIKPF
jgi:hypothetical protein